MRQKFYIFLIVFFAVSSLGLWFLGLDILLAVPIGLIFAFFVRIGVELLVLRPAKGVYFRIAKLEENANEYNIGTRLLIRRDLELARANEKLQQFDEIKSNFISVVAHQLRTPLSGIKWTLNMILNGEMGELNNDQKTFLMKSYESNNRMITLVNDMLDTDRIQSGKVHFGFRYINIVDLLDNVLFEISPEAAKKQISIEFRKKLENLPQAYIDPESMRAVFQNLLDNSIKYTMEGGRIELDIEAKENFLQISISDNGIGIPQAEQKKIFDRFFRAGNAVKLQTDGSGLGLYIAREIVEKNGGKIWFESLEGKGTAFHFTVPLKLEDIKNK